MSTDQTPALARATEAATRALPTDAEGCVHADTPVSEAGDTAARAAVSAALEVEEMAALIWETSRRDEGTISATGAKHVAQALRAHLLGDA